MSSMAVPLAGAPVQSLAASTPTVLPSNMQLSRNPMLPQHPLGQYTDAQYEAQDALLRNQIAKQYADILQQLGYTDESGNFIQGSVEANAGRQTAELGRSMGLAREDVTHQHQQQGTLFSGLRGTDQARAEYPYSSQISQIETDTPLTLQQLYERASGLVGDFSLQENQLLADAAARQAAGLTAAGGGPPVGGGAAGGGVPTAQQLGVGQAPGPMEIYGGGGGFPTNLLNVSADQGGAVLGSPSPLPGTPAPGGVALAPHPLPGQPNPAGGQVVLNPSPLPAQPTGGLLTGVHPLPGVQPIDSSAITSAINARRPGLQM